MPLFYVASSSAHGEDLGLFIHAADAGHTGKLLADYWTAQDMVEGSASGA